ncbi:MAG: hypothetical protein JKY53_10840 [Flavobacteriales bacterium]|nr:hypothetical protein [Flavobacteriales bacterium]
MSLRSDARYSKSNSNNDFFKGNNEQTDFRVILYLEETFRVYYFRKLFFETGLKSNLGYRYSDNKNEGTNLETGLNSYYDGTYSSFYPIESVPIVTGIGRVYESTDARMAMYIVEDLQKKGLINQQPNGETLKEISRLITKIKNNRVFDSRLKKIYELSMIDSLFQENDIVNKIDAAYFTTVYDNWLYAFTQSRKNGWEIKINYTPSFNQIFHKQAYTSYQEVEGGQPAASDVVETSQRSDIGGYLSLNTNYHLPIGNRWQVDAEAELVYIGKYPANENEYVVMEDPEFIGVRDAELAALVNVNIGYFPTSRTQITTPIRLGIISDNVARKYFYTGLRVDYYLSPYIRVSAQYSYNYIYTEQNIFEGGNLRSKRQSNYVFFGFKYILF